MRTGIEGWKLNGWIKQQNERKQVTVAPWGLSQACVRFLWQ